MAAMLGLANFRLKNDLGGNQSGWRTSPIYPLYNFGVDAAFRLRHRLIVIHQYFEC
jgi:hypothetical protein